MFPWKLNIILWITQLTPPQSPVALPARPPVNHSMGERDEFFSEFSLAFSGVPGIHAPKGLVSVPAVHFL